LNYGGKVRGKSPLLAPH